MSDSQYNPVESRLLSVEQKVNLLLIAAAIQVVTILISWINFLFGSVFWFIVFLLAVGGLLYALRHQLPELSGKFIRFVFSRPGEPSSSEVSKTDSETSD